MPEMTNDERAYIAKRVLGRYAYLCKYKDPVPAEVLGDLLGDLRHFAKAHGVDFEQCNRNAKACFEEESHES